MIFMRLLTIDGINCLAIGIWFKANLSKISDAQVASILREPLALLADKCASSWSESERFNTVLLNDFQTNPHCN